MVWIVLALILVVIGEVFLVKFYRDTGKEFEKYDKKNSDVLASSIEEFVSKIGTMSGFQINSADYSSNKIYLLYMKNEYVISIEEGRAFVEYDKSGCQRRMSAIGRLFRIFKFGKASQKAAMINIVMDYAAGRNISEQEQQCRKIAKERNLLKILIIAIMVFSLVGFLSVIQNMSQIAITKMKETEFIEGVTYEELIDGYLKTVEWKAFNSDAHTAVVEVKGMSVENEEICIQFWGDGRGYGNIDRQNFSLKYFEIDGVSVDPNISMEIIYEYLFETVSEEIKTDVEGVVKESEPVTQTGDMESNQKEEDYYNLQAFIDCICTYSDPPMLSEVELEAYFIQEYNSWLNGTGYENVYMNVDGTFTWQQPTSLYYDAYAPIISDVYATYGEYCEYGLYDFDNDGICELITSFGTCDADWANDVYTISNGCVNMLGQFYGVVSYYAEENGNGIYAVNGRMGYHTVEWITKEGNDLYSCVVLDEEVSDDNYYSNPYPIPIYPITDTGRLMQ